MVSGTDDGQSASYLERKPMNHIHDLTILNRILERGLCHGEGDGVTTFCAEQAVAAVCGGSGLGAPPTK